MKRRACARLIFAGLFVVLAVVLFAPTPAFGSACWAQYQSALENCGYSYHGLDLVMCSGESVAEYAGCIRGLL